MDRFMKLLNHIRQRPALYLGVYDLSLLHALIGGYLICLMYEGLEESAKEVRAFLDGFQAYVTKRYDNISLTHNWCNLIEFYNRDGRAAIERFYELLDDYMQGVPARYE